MLTLSTSPNPPLRPHEDDTELQPETTWVVSTDDGGQAHVLIHNDDVTPMDFVLIILRQIFLLGEVEAERVMLRAHYTGVAYVQTTSLEEAKYRVGKAHSLAREAGYPLRFTIELDKAA
jgi:ATP-dependent Clp protease adaptor protein ClpS